jgi:hypothetical protein
MAIARPKEGVAMTRWLAIASLVALITCPVALCAEKQGPFSIEYAYAGLTEITVKDGKLHYIWHTPRQWDDPKTLDRSGLENYDRHQIDVWLTDKEARLFRDWIARHKVFEFDKAYPSPPGGNSRGAAFQSGLTVVQSEKKYGVSWAGDSKIPKALAAAENDLTALCDEIQKSRSK